MIKYCIRKTILSDHVGITSITCDKFILLSSTNVFNY